MRALTPPPRPALVRPVAHGGTRAGVVLTIGAAIVVALAHAIAAHQASGAPSAGAQPSCEACVPALAESVLARGRDLYATHCMACHGPAAQGAAVGLGAVAPSLRALSADVIARMPRVGPGMMPQFPPEVLPDGDLDLLARYVVYLQTAPHPGGTLLGLVGPVGEGLVAWVYGIGLLLIVIWFTGRPS